MAKLLRGCAAVFILCGCVVHAEQCGGLDGSGLCRTAGPATVADQPQWLAALRADRDATVAKTHFEGGVFDNPALKWANTAWVQPQMHPFDNYFYDRVARNYTVARWLGDLDTRYGGIDATLVWPGYPNLGVDDRNQWDMFRALPGGLDAVTGFTSELLKRGVRVLWPYLYWDTGTRREDGNATDEETAVALLRLTGGAGLNGDSLPFVPESFWNASVAADYPLALQAEGGASDSALRWSTLGWGYWGRQSNPPDAAGYNWTYATVPLVDRFKFETNGAFLTTMCERYRKNKTANLQHAWFNGDGYESWESVWGAWNGIVPRDGEALRRVATMLRFWGSTGALHSRDWEPHAYGPVTFGVFASTWPVPAPATEPERWRPNKRTAAVNGTIGTLFTIVNRSGKNLTGVQLIAVPPASAATRAEGSRGDTLDGAPYYYDCYGGRALSARPVSATTLQALQRGMSPPPAGAVELELELEVGGFGCVAVLDAPAGAQGSVVGLAPHLAAMRALTYGRPLAALDATWRPLPQTMAHVHESTPLAPLTAGSSAGSSAAARALAGMVLVARSRNYHFRASDVQIEGTAAVGEGFQYPWEAAPRKQHDAVLDLGPFYLDRSPVTCANYSQFLQATGYRPPPGHAYRWLHNWQWHNSSASDAEAVAVPPPLPTPGAALADVPVTYVGLGEARAYCSWRGARLPHSFEWQYAAQGPDNDGRKYPWGNDTDPSLYPTPTTDGGVRPAPVGAHSPLGDSPFGVRDLVGNVWQWTDEFGDAHTRRAALRGGSNFRPAGGSSGAGWYFPNVLDVSLQNKYLLMDDSYERAGTVGFRCLVDADDSAEGATATAVDMHSKNNKVHGARGQSRARWSLVM